MHSSRQTVALLLLVSAGCTDAAPVAGVASGSSSAASARASARAFSSAELEWTVAAMPPGHPLGVTRAAMRSAVELDGEIAVVFYLPLEKMEPAKQAAKALELMRPSFPKSTKVAVLHTETQGVPGIDTGFVFMHRGDQWLRDATAEETALVEKLLRDVPGGPAPSGSAGP